MNKELLRRAAITLADEDGIEALIMRRLSHKLGIKAMSLYDHVANKDDILYGIVDIIVNEIDVPSSGAD
ncbi:MAG: TetR family transcriptional regulator [Planctomycetota bacterium]|nr:TetR family transcriptional regulator [Planctomycetota bacterium]